MSAEENKALVGRFHDELWNNKNAAIISELCSSEYAAYLGGAALGGSEALRQVAAVWYTAFPDLRFTDNEMIAEGDRVAVRWTARVTHTGPLHGPGGSIPATNKPATFTGIGLFRIEGGQIVEQRVEIDQLGLMQQLGVIPAPGQAVG